MNYTDTTLGEVASAIQTGPFGSQLHSYDYSDAGTPVIMPQDIVDWSISEDKIARVNDNHVQRLQRHKTAVGDIIYPRRGDLAKCAFISEKEQDWLCGTGCLKVSIDKSKANPKYVFFHLQQPYSISCIENATVGSTMPNLNTSILSKVKLRLPDMAVQNRIVKILSDYDNLIELNRRRIAILEEMAMRTYQEWFVHFRFPGHKTAEFVDGLPKGWSYKSLEELGKVVGGATPKTANENYYCERGKGIEWVTPKDMATNKSIFISEGAQNITELGYKSCSCFMLPKGSILFTSRAPIGYIAIADKEMCTNQGFKSFCPQRIGSCFSYFSIRLATPLIKSKSNGSTFEEISLTQMKSFKILVPSTSCLQKFEEIVSPIFTTINSLTKQNDSLQQMRDRLLPQLMSGQLEVIP
ncbi:MAG: restriction endonuclease subunit S [Muribaculaceae bacterium]|nr:restriction endonuclease subunit S [Muribaculaceae bacterium]